MSAIYQLAAHRDELFSAPDVDPKLILLFEEFERTLIEEFQIEQSLGELFVKFRGPAFLFRLHVIQLFDSFNEVIDMHTEVEIELHYDAPESRLESAIQQLASLAMSISGDGLDHLNQEEVLGSPQSIKETPNISYQNFLYTFQSIPKKVGVPLLNWSNDSLDTEIGLFLLELILDGELRASEKKIEEIISFTALRLESYTAHAILLDLWKPQEGDQRQIVQNARIVASALEVSYGAAETQTASLEDLVEMIEELD